MAFKKFTETGKGFAPKVSIWSRGQIGFNKGAIKRFKVDQYTYAIFYYDEENELIGIELTNDKNDDGLHKVNVRTSGVMISAKAFLDYHGIDLTATRQFDLKKDDESRLLVIDLKDSKTKGNQKEK